AVPVRAGVGVELALDAGLGAPVPVRTAAADGRIGAELAAPVLGAGRLRLRQSVIAAAVAVLQADLADGVAAGGLLADGVACRRAGGPECAGAAVTAARRNALLERADRAAAGDGVSGHGPGALAAEGGDRQGAAGPAESAVDVLADARAAVRALEAG